MPSNTDQLLQNIQQGKDRAVLDVLNSQLMPKLKSYILANRGDKNEVKEVFQEVVYIIYRKVKMERFHPEGDLLNYMFVIGKNSWIARSVKQQKMDDIDSFKESMDTGEEESLHKLMSEERNKAALGILDSIGQQCKELLNLRIYEEMDLSEIAEKLKMSNSDVVKSTIYRCKKKLKEKIMKNKGFLQLLDIKP